MFGINLNPLNAGIKVLNVADELKDTLVETAVDVASDIVGDDVAQLALNAFTWQGQLSRIGLEKALDIVNDGN